MPIISKTTRTRLQLFQEICERCVALQEAEPKNANAWYIHAYALGRYSQGISIVKALAQGLGGKIKHSLDQTLKLQPRHADAHIALGTWHAEIIDKVGSMVGGLTYGAKKDAAEKHFRAALELNPDSSIARTEYANGLVLLFGRSRAKDVDRLREEAVACTRPTPWKGSTSRQPGNWRTEATPTGRGKRPRPLAVRRAAYSNSFASAAATASGSPSRSQGSISTSIRNLSNSLAKRSTID